MIIKTLKLAKRWIMIIFGFTLLIIGILLAIPGVPGPGILIVWSGLAILALEFIWARKLLKKFEDQGTRLKDLIVSQRGKYTKQTRPVPSLNPDPD